MSTHRSHQMLLGPWRFLLDPERRGVESKWHEGVAWDSAAEVRVPGRWTDWSDSGDGVAWLFHRFDWHAPEGEHDAQLVLTGLGPRAELWLNGVRLGTHESVLTTGRFDVDRHLRSTDNLLALRLEVEQAAAPLSTGPSGAAKLVERLAGLTDSVALYAAPHARIEEVHVQPDYRRNRINVQVGATGGDTIRLEVAGTSYASEGPVGSLVVDMPGFTAWTSAAPHLYTLACSLYAAERCVDTVQVRFGMSEFTVKDDRFCLNNRPLWLKGVLHEVAYPLRASRETWATEARRELEAARDAGFNLVYLRGGLAPEESLDAADALGMLVGVEAPNEPAASTHVLESLVRRARNHPSVAFWTAAPQCGADSRSLDTRFARIRALDPNRLILGAPGLAGQVPNAATLLRPFRDAPEEFDDFQVYQGTPLSAVAENYLRNVGRESGLCLLSGFGVGGPGLESPDPAWAVAREGFRSRELAGGFGEFASLVDAARILQRDDVGIQFDAIRANGRIAGYCYGQLRGTGEGWFGLLDESGKAKPALAAIEEAQRPVRPLIRMVKTNLVPRETVSVTVLLANETRLEGRGDISLQVVGPTNQVLWKKKRGIKLPRHGKVLWEGAVSASGSIGMHQFVVRVLYENRIIAENSVAFFVVSAPKPSDVAVHLVDPHNAWGKTIGAHARLEGLLSPIHVVPPLANTVRGYPDNELMQVLAQVRGGAVALVFSPPDDWNALAAQFEEDISATSFVIGGTRAPYYHYARLHPVFAGLPTRGFMGRPYRNLAPWRTFQEASDEEICDSFFTGLEDRPPRWGSAVLVRRHGEGRIVFVHLRILEYLGIDPVAEHVFANLVGHFARRSVPSKSPLAPNSRSVEWLRMARGESVRRWMVLGEFPNEGETGLVTVHPPETEIDLDATYPGTYKAVSWEPWYTLSENEHRLDLQSALAPLWQAYPRQDRATGYAYAEFLLERRQAAILCLSRLNATKAWLNGKEVLAAAEMPPFGKIAEERISIFLRQGKNTLLVKCAKNAGPFGFALDILGERGESVPMKWWR